MPAFVPGIQPRELVLAPAQAVPPLLDDPVQAPHVVVPAPGGLLPLGLGQHAADYLAVEHLVDLVHVADVVAVLPSTRSRSSSWASMRSSRPPPMSWSLPSSPSR